MNINELKQLMKEVEKLCLGSKLELIDGKVYTITTPSRMHQFLSMHISARY